MNILVDLNNAVVWMVSSRPLISKFSSPFINPLVTVPRAPITIGINVTFMFHSFFNSQARSRYLSYFSLSFNFKVVSQDSKVNNFASSLFLIIRSRRLAEMKRSVCMTKSQRSLCMSISGIIIINIVCVILQDRCWVVHIPFVCMVKLEFLA